MLLPLTAVAFPACILAYICVSWRKDIPEVHEVLLPLPLIKTSMLILGTMMFCGIRRDSTVQYAL